MEAYQLRYENVPIKHNPFLSAINTPRTPSLAILSGQSDKSKQVTPFAKRTFQQPICQS